MINIFLLHLIHAAMGDNITIAVPVDIIDSAEALVITVYNNSALFPIFISPEYDHVADTAVFGFSPANISSSDNLMLPVVITLQGYRAQENRVITLRIFLLNT